MTAHGGEESGTPHLHGSAAATVSRVVADIAHLLESGHEASTRIAHVLAHLQELVSSDLAALLWNRRERPEDVPALFVTESAHDVDRSALQDRLEQLCRIINGRDELRESSQDGTRLAVPVVGLDQLIGVLTVHRAPAHVFDLQDVRLLSAVASQLGAYLTMLALQEERARAESSLREQVQVRESLDRVAAVLAAELNRDTLAQRITDEATTLTSAEFGFFLYNIVEASGQAHMLHALSGASREELAQLLPNPRATPLVEATFDGGTHVRLGDVRLDPRSGAGGPVPGIPIVSYLAVPVASRSGEVLGGLFFGHSQAAMFTPRHERLAAGIASWAAVALDNAHLYAAAQASSRMRDEFVATLSHELRTPLNAILGWARLLRRDPVTPTMQARALDAIERNAQIQVQLVDDLLDMSRIISGKLRVKAEPVELASVVAGAVETVRPAITARNQTLEVAADPATHPLVTGDEGRLQQVVWNLLSNAVKFTPSGGHIRVGLGASGGWAEIEVTDTGEGMAPEMLPHLFERFWQADRSASRRHGGLGIGLSIVRYLTEAHGGSVAGDSGGPGKGSTFIVRLPLRDVRQKPV